MKKIFYEKIGKRYKPVKEYDDELTRAFTKGAHLVVCRPGSISYTHRIDPMFAPMLAAGTYAEDAMARAISEEMATLRLESHPITKEQHKLWSQLAESFMETDLLLYRPASIESARAGIAALEKEVEKMLSVPAVKKAYEQFMLVWKLTKEHQQE